MVTIVSLWMPILLSAALIFMASSFMHMVLRYHWSDWGRLPDEDAARTALGDVPPGNYVVPHAGSMAAMKTPEYAKKRESGPNALLYVHPAGPPKMGPQLVGWFVYSLVVGIVVAYVVSRTVAADAAYLQIFRVSGVTALLAYAGAEPINSIWKGASWSSTLKSMIDGLVYSLLTAGAFAGFWPA